MKGKKKRRGLALFKKLKEGLQLVGNSAVPSIVCLKRIFLESSSELPESSENGEIPLNRWKERYDLFSRFDEGIQMDEESWYSVTHEEIAKHIARCCQNASSIMDAFSGVGGNSVHFAKHCSVIAVDIDQSKLDMLSHNARIYEVADKLNFICSDFTKLDHEEVDAVFASPPWGGPSYKLCKTYDLHAMKPPLTEIIQKMSLLSSNLILYLPKSIDPHQLVEIVELVPGVPNKIELHLCYLDGKSKAVCCFIGDLVHPNLERLAELLLVRYCSSDSSTHNFMDKIALSVRLEQESLTDVIQSLNR